MELPRWWDCPGDRPAFVGADLRPETLTAAFRAGFFPWPPATEHWREWHARTWGADLSTGRIRTVGTALDFTLPWWAPDPRGVLVPQRAWLRKRLARYARQSGWTSTVDEATSAVIERCGPQRGVESWLSDELAEAYRQLSGIGLTHSVEIWDGEQLIGGVFGVLVGGIFSAESTFAARSNAGHFAMLELAMRLAAAGGELIDLHMVSPHFAALGAQDLPREQFHRLLDASADQPVILPAGRLEVARLAELLPAHPPGLLPAHPPELLPAHPPGSEPA
ncbi:MAG: leucyl/phenylalanyl-tRNA--protein transferase [Jatrophihabitans sp.]